MTDTLDRFYAPISADQPCGDWLRYSEVYQQISRMRIQEDPTLPMGEWARPLLSADWEAIEQKISLILEQQSKDLNLVVWLCEAWIHRQGLVGLDHGLILLTELCRRFWPHLWPADDQEDNSPRLAPFLWLNQKLPATLRQKVMLLPQTASRSYGVSLDDWERMAAGQPSGRLAAKPTAEALRASLTQSDQAQLLAVSSLVDAIRGHLTELLALLQELAPSRDPSFSALDTLLVQTATACGRLRKEVTPEKSLDQSAPGAEDATHTAAADSAANSAANSATDFATVSANRQSRDPDRRQAYLELARLTERLERLDPHSPAPLLLARAVDWAGLSLAEIAQAEAARGSSLWSILTSLGLEKGFAIEDKEPPSSPPQ